MLNSQKKTVWVTRPKIRSKTFISFLKEYDFNVLHQPVFHVHPARFSIDDINQSADALIFTSQNAVNIITPFREEKSTLCIAVGDSTADLLKESGFVNVISLDGTAKDIQNYIDNNFQENQTLLYFSGQKVKRDLQSDRVKINRFVVYQTEYIDDVDPEFLTAFLNIDLVCFFSSATYAAAWALIEKYNLQVFCKDIEAVVLRSSIIDVEHQKNWKSVTAPQHPSMVSLQKLIVHE